MMIKVRVMPNSKSESIEALSSSDYRVKVREKAMEGKANDAVLRAISIYFNVRRSDVLIVKGATSRDKVIEVKTQ